MPKHIHFIWHFLQVQNQARVTFLFPLSSKRGKGATSTSADFYFSGRSSIDGFHLVSEKPNQTQTPLSHLHGVAPTMKPVILKQQSSHNHTPYLEHHLNSRDQFLRSPEANIEIRDSWFASPNFGNQTDVFLHIWLKKLGWVSGD